MTDFQVTPVTTEDVDKTLEIPQENENSLARFRRIAKLAAKTSALNKWCDVVEGACVS